MKHGIKLVKAQNLPHMKNNATNNATKYLMQFHPVQDLSLVLLYVFVLFCFVLFCKNNELKLPFYESKIPPEH